MSGWNEKRQKIESVMAQCNGSMWTDGGHWNGSGPEPDCSGALQESVRDATIIPEDAWAAEQMNKIRDDASKMVSRGGTAASVVGSLAGIAVSTGVGAGIGIAIALVSLGVSELVGRIPTIHPKYRVRYYARNSASLSPYQVSSNKFEVYVKNTITDDRDRVIYSESGVTRSINLNDFRGDDKFSDAMGKFIDMMTKGSLVKTVYLSRSAALTYDFTQGRHATVPTITERPGLSAAR